MMETQDSLIGYTLGGRYLIERFLAEERIGKVYVARNLSTLGLVDVKVLHPHLASDPEVLGRFGREMLATASVQHPNSVAMLDFGEQRLFHYIVLEHVEGPTLSRVLERDGQFSHKRVVHIAAQVAGALAAAHGQGIFHRNLSASTVLLVATEDGSDLVKVRDFGIARLADPELGDEGLTAVDGRLGDLEYMAPEYIQDGEFDPRGDLYALGIIMYEMLAGKPPFRGKGGEVMDMHVYHQPRPLGPQVRRLPKWLNELVMRLIEKDPEARPTSAQEVVDILERGSGRSLTAPDRTTARPADRQFAPPPTTSKVGKVVKTAFQVLLGVVLAILVAAVLAAGLWVAFPS